MEIRNRIKELRLVSASELRENPANWRKHTAEQKGALIGILEEVGYADALIARECEDGSLELVDGHLRADVTGDQEVPVLVLDVTQAEAQKLLATLDPLAAMAEKDADKLDSLLREVQTGNEDLAALFTELAGLQEPKPARELAEIEPNHSVLIRCEDEAEQLVLLDELDRHGLETRALSIGWEQPPPIEREDEKELSVTAKKITRTTKIKKTARVKQLAGMYDLPPKEETSQSWVVDLNLDRPWNIGLIVGASGSGKTTVARELFAQELVDEWPWPKDRSLIDGFPKGMPVGEIVNLLSSVGFSSPPSWLKPYHVLSNGEKFRVTLARTMAEMPDLAVVDEFTSVVDRTVAQIGSAAVAKTLRKTNRRMVAVTCHYDVEEWLQPDWKYEPATGQFQWRCLRRRPDIQLSIRRAPAKQAWPMFRGHHYLSGKLNPAAACFVATIEGRPAAFVGVLSTPGRNSSWRESRTVCLPDFQGVGIGTQLSNFVASLYATRNKPYRSTTSHPAMIAHRTRSPLWKLTRAPSLNSGINGAEFQHFAKTQSSNRLTCGFEYCGPADRENARKLGVLKE